MKNLFALIVCGMMVFACENQDAPFLKMQDDKLISTHALQFELQQPLGFRAAEPVTHFPAFNNHPFKVSLSGFMADSEAILVHAEEVLDQSGTLDYSSLERDTLSNIEFGVRSMCAELTDEEIEEEHDIQYLSKNGFTLQPGVFLIQFLTNTADKNQEYIVSYAKTVSSCSDTEMANFMPEVRNRISSVIKLKKLH